MKTLKKLSLQRETISRTVRSGLRAGKPADPQLSAQVDSMGAGASAVIQAPNMSIAASILVPMPPVIVRPPMPLLPDGGE